MAAIVLAGTAFLTGCADDWSDEAAEITWSAEVSYFVCAPVVVTTLLPQEPYRTNWPIEVLVATAGSLTPAGWNYQGATMGPTWTGAVQLQLSEAKDTVPSVVAHRVKYSGAEWERTDRIEVQGIPLFVDESSDGVWVYRLTGPAVCGAVSE